MDKVLGALAPVFLLIILGWIVRATRVASVEALAHVNRFGYFVLYPAFLFTTVAGASFDSADAGPFLLGILLAFLAVSALALATRVFIKDGPAFTSVFQGATRWNGFAILAAAAEIFGPLGRPFIALIFGPTVLMNNIISVAVLARWGTHGKTSLRFIVAQVAGNPLVLSCAAGLLAHAVGAPDLGPVTDALTLLGQAAMPVALICVGAGIDLGATRSAHKEVVLATAIKLLAAPIVFWFVVRACGGGPVAAAIAVGVGCTPTAAATYALAREMGGDDRLMAAIVSVTTLVSFVTMPIAIALALPR